MAKKNDIAENVMNIVIGDKKYIARQVPMKKLASMLADIREGWGEQRKEIRAIYPKPEDVAVRLEELKQIPIRKPGIGDVVQYCAMGNGMPMLIHAAINGDEIGVSLEDVEDNLGAAQYMQDIDWLLGMTDKTNEQKEAEKELGLREKQKQGEAATP